MILSVDGGCDGVKDTASGKIAATSQQYPLKMASMGVQAGLDYAKSGKKQSGYVDTGVTLIANKKLKDIASEDAKTGLNLCWGKK
jgi:fructose transport system substrate-binding protein